MLISSYISMIVSTFILVIKYDNKLSATISPEVTRIVSTIKSPLFSSIIIPFRLANINMENTDNVIPVQKLLKNLFLVFIPNGTNNNLSMMISFALRSYSFQIEEN